MTSPAYSDIGLLIDSTPGVYGGLPRLARSGLPILQFAADYQSGMRVEDFLDAYPQLDEESIYAGMAFYLVNRNAVDAQLARREEIGREHESAWLQERAG